MQTMSGDYGVAVIFQGFGPTSQTLKTLIYIRWDNCANLHKYPMQI